ncbi:MAG: hypothetical protein IPM82_02390 [Saprospiraceae bacterium]|nr:hypothetical protein [Saprospiraceae bacterium]
MKRTLHLLFTLAANLVVAQGAFAQQHDRHWMGMYFLGQPNNSPVFMGFDADTISYQVHSPPSEVVTINESVAMSDASGELRSSIPTATWWSPGTAIS